MITRKQIEYEFMQFIVGIALFFSKRRIDIVFMWRRIVCTFSKRKKEEYLESDVKRMMNSDTFKVTSAFASLGSYLNMNLMNSTALKYVHLFIRNEIQNEKDFERINQVFTSKASKRRLVYDLLLHYKDIQPHQINFKFPSETRIDFEDWLDTPDL